MDLVQDDPVDAREGFAELRRAQDNREALRGRDENVRRRAGLLLPFLGRGVAGPHADSDCRLGLPFFLGKLRELRERLLEVAIDVVRERF